MVNTSGVPAPSGGLSNPFFKNMFKSMNYIRAVLTFAALLACAGSLWAEVKLAPLFTDGIILQRDAVVRIWGTSDPSETVRVEFAGQSVDAVADASGDWMLELAPLNVSSTGRVLTVTGTKADKPLKVQDVLVGEVWLAGGQSNMKFDMKFFRKTTQTDIDNANDPLLRMASVGFRAYPMERQPSELNWLASQPEHVAGFSATAYYFAKHLRETLDVPVGIISCSVGGTPAEAWMSRESLSSTPELKRILNAYDQHVAASYASEADYLAALDNYQQANRLRRDWLKNKVGEEPPRVKYPIGPQDFTRPCGLYENMLSQVIPASIRGVIWYQGEHNASMGNGALYRTVFSVLIESWRADFKQPQMPFLFVQLATLGRGPEAGWAELRDSQGWVNQHVPHTGMEVALDAGERNDIHPHTKAVVGERLALLARKQVYGETALVAESPRLIRAEPQGEKLILSFDNIGSGLVLNSEGENTFAISGDDGVFVPAQAKLVGDTVEVYADSVSAPKYVRYGWHIWVEPTLFNVEGLPAEPFRSDAFPLATEGEYYLKNLTK